MKQKKVAVVGGGAAGMMAAIRASECGASVTIFEKNNRLGQKILSTGNGKCNLGNRNLDESMYHTGNPHWLKKALASFGTDDTMSFFEELGLQIKDKNGYLYPSCEQAAVVLDVLRYRISDLGIEVSLEAGVSNIRKKDGQFLIKDHGKNRCFDSVILCCGGKSAPKTGSDGSGYAYAKSFGHHITPTVPALTFLTCREEYFKSVSGVRADGVVTLFDKEKRVLQRERGDLQLTDSGISGIPVFQLCRTAAYELQRKRVVTASIDFLPEENKESIAELVRKRSKLQKNRSLEEYLTGLLNKKIISFLIRSNGYKTTEKASTLRSEQMQNLLLTAKRVEATVTGTGSFSNSQVTAGGVDVGEIKDTMESALVDGLYFAGEILDVDGRCGGYNLQWCWTSGYLAGTHAAMDF